MNSHKVSVLASSCSFNVLNDYPRVQSGNFIIRRVNVLQKKLNWISKSYIVAANTHSFHWLIYLIEFYAVSTIFQPCNGHSDEIPNKKVYYSSKLWYYGTSIFYWKIGSMENKYITTEKTMVLWTKLMALSRKLFNFDLLRKKNMVNYLKLWNFDW